MRDHRLRGAPCLERSAHRGARAARESRLRLGRDRAPRGRLPRVRARRRQPREPEGRGGPQPLGGDDGARAHALGHARRGQRGERAPPHRLRRGQARGRPQRDRRELHRAQGEAPGRGPHVQLRDGRRGRRTPARGRLPRRPRRGGARRVRPARGALHVRRHPPRRAAAPRCRAPADAARRRSRRGRELPRLEHDRVPLGDAPRAVPGRRRRRRAHARGRPLR